MKWLISIAIALEAPILFLVFIAAGTGGNKTAAFSIWAGVIFVSACMLYTLYRLHISPPLGPFDWIVAVVAISPIAFGLLYAFDIVKL